MKRPVVLLVVLLTALLMATVYAQEPIRIGVNLELSGRFVALGTPELEGIEAAREQLPEVLGRPIELSICDNATSPEQSIACANRFVDEGVLAVIGTGGSSQAIPAAEVLQDAGIIMITPSSTNPATTQIGDYIFRMSYTDDFQGVVAAQYAANDLSAASAAIFRQQDDDYSFGLAGFFQEEFESSGGQTVIVDFTANTADFSAQINDIRGFNPDIVYYAGFCPEGVALLPQLRQQGFEQQVLGADASDDAQCPEAGGDAFDGYIFTAFGEPEQLTGEAAERAQAFENAFFEVNPNGTFNGFTLAGADSYNALVQAIEDAGSDEVDAVREALANLENYPGVSGEITFAGTDGTPLDRTIGFFSYQVPGDDGEAWAKVAEFGLSTGGGEGDETGGQ